MNYDYVDTLVLKKTGHYFCVGGGGGVMEFPQSNALTALFGRISRCTES